MVITVFSRFKQWVFSALREPPSALPRIRLGPPGSADNFIMVCKRPRGHDAYDLWDLGEFDQRGSVETRRRSKKRNRGVDGFRFPGKGCKVKRTKMDPRALSWIRVGP
ncbi:hypothetical protein LshimejAT787_0803030 [Lyophyllum shimeji]|uniref:Uncharacterized protein n=1 Tax=Lyophyllum shimeji TaxID=47721 RepID=A0A9P3PPU9_LYOSH|nr:hypothetical protein LshimejAT787_0803030 [Lyophyllum shimeji]